MTEFKELQQDIRSLIDRFSKEGPHFCQRLLCTTCGGYGDRLRNALPEEDFATMKRVLSSISYDEYEQISSTEVGECLEYLCGEQIRGIEAKELLRVSEERGLKRIEREDNVSSMLELEAIPDWHENYQFRFY